MVFPVLDLDDWELRGVEQQGVTEHPWLVDPDDGDLWLWKPAADRRLARREHWAEKIASELAGLLGLPCAQVELASRRGVAGCVSRNVLAHGADIHWGAFLLAEIDPTFDPNVRGHSVYTVENVARVLAGARAPSTLLGPPLPTDANGFDVMAGYLLFDALVRNRDRHAVTWAVARRRDGAGPDVLLPMYDNASSLGLSLSEDTMRKRYESKGIAAYTKREGWARPFARTADGTALLRDVAGQALHLCTLAAREHWLAQVDALSSPAIATVVDAVPGMSQVVRTFVLELLESTRKEIADGIGAS